MTTRPITATSWEVLGPDGAVIGYVRKTTAGYAARAGGADIQTTYTSFEQAVGAVRAETVSRFSLIEVD